jgi:hypothetical protein
MAGSFIIIAILSPGVFWLRNIFDSGPREAPEAERVLSAQVELPFQVLIPAYLPNGFDREKMVISTDQPAPAGEAMVRLTYTTRKGYSLVISEWVPDDPALDQTGSNARSCMCVCRSRTECDLFGMDLTADSVRVSVRFSAPNLLSYEQLQFMLDTLGPATNLQVYSSIEEIPLSFSVPPAVDVPVNGNGVQELTLVVSPQGYSPVHFAVKKDVPVRLIFRQLGEVGCGNELIFQWGERESATLVLAAPSDTQVLEFTPGEAGEFRFNCPHLIYRGVMTVTD